MVREEALHARHRNEIRGSRDHLPLLLVVHHLQHVESVEVIERGDGDLIDSNGRDFFNRPVEIFLIIAGRLQRL